MYKIFAIALAFLFFIPSISQLSQGTPQSDLVIGDDQPDETFYITNTTFDLIGNLIIINQGRVVVENSWFLVQGNILVFNNGSIYSNNSTIGFHSLSRWQYTLNLYNDASLYIVNSTFYSDGYPNLLNAFHNSTVIIKDTLFSDWLTCLFSDNSSVVVRDCNGSRGYTSEFFFRDHSQGELHHITGVINVFYIFQKDSIVDYSPFLNEYVNHFEFPNDVPTVYNVKYTVVIDSCFILGNTPLIERGANVTLRNATSSIIIRTTNDDSLNLTGLTSLTYHADWVVPIEDRQIHLVNFTIRNWHIQMFDNSIVSLSNSIVSELLCTGNSTLYLENVIYKGDCGPFWVWGTSLVYAKNCIFLAEDPTGLNPVTFVRDTSLLILYESYVYTDIFLEDQGTMILLNSETFREPILADTASLWSASIHSPPTGTSNSSIPITGSAFIKDGPGKVKSSFLGYQLFYASPPGYQEFKPIDDLKKKPVYDDILIYWDTHTLENGLYVLRLTIQDIYGNNMSTYWKIQLKEKQNKILEIFNQLPVLLKQVFRVNHKFQTINSADNQPFKSTRWLENKEGFHKNLKSMLMENLEYKEKTKMRQTYLVPLSR